MNKFIRKGVGFGLTTSIITNIGLIVGLNATTHSKVVIISGLLVIAIADSLSDALGIHISEESENHHTKKEIWTATISTFFSKLIIGLTFIIPILLLTLTSAIITSIAWGLLLIGLFSFYIAKIQKIKPYKVITEHVAIAVAVIIITHYLGNLAAYLI